MTKELLKIFLNNNCTSKELDEIIQWIDKEALSDKSKNLARDYWKLSNIEESVNNHNEKFDSLLDKIHHKINIIHQNKGSKSQKAVSIMITWFTRAAAVLLIPVLIFLFYTLSNNSFNSGKYADSVVDSLEIIAPVGSRAVVQLSDGTEVHLNYGSKIKYPRIFKGNTRELTLSGEGYFEVAHNTEKPFIVKAKGLNIKATGTKFNVMAYPDDHSVAATLVEGEVIMERSDIKGNIKTIETMIPGQHVDYNTNTGVASSSKGNTKKYIAWKDGLLVFDNTSIKEVADRLERMFNVDIDIAGEIKDYTYTVTFVDEPLFQILYLITQATPVRYKAFPRIKLPDGTFSKQKIVLEKK